MKKVEITCGMYGHHPKKDGPVRPVRRGEKVDLHDEEAARLVKLGLAKYVDEPAEKLPDLPEGVVGIPVYSEEMSAKELREIGKLCGLTFKVGMSKAEMVAALDAHIAEHTVEGVEVDEDGEIATEDDAPTFDAAEAVQ